MREILFRGKREYTGEWAESVCPLGAMHAGHLCDDFEPSTVGQYTGLTDKNGKRIFEGDICRFREWSKGEMCWFGKVYWENQQFMISGGRNKECETPFALCMSRFISENIEVLGNIHDNPELLKQGDADGV